MWAVAAPSSRAAPEKSWPALAARSEFKTIYDRIVETFSEDNKKKLKEAYADLIADNDEGHARLQQKLAAAAAAK